MVRFQNMKAGATVNKNPPSGLQLLYTKD